MLTFLWFIRSEFFPRQAAAALHLVSKHGFVYQWELCDAIAAASLWAPVPIDARIATDVPNTYTDEADAVSVMRALVRHGFLHYRPNTVHSCDVPDRIEQRDEPVLCAPSPAALYKLREKVAAGRVV